MKETLSIKVTPGLKKYLREQAEAKRVKPADYMLACLLKGAAVLEHRTGRDLIQSIGRANSAENIEEMREGYREDRDSANGEMDEVIKVPDEYDLSLIVEEIDFINPTDPDAIVRFRDAKQKKQAIIDAVTKALDGEDIRKEVGDE